MLFTKLALLLGCVATIVLAYPTDELDEEIRYQGPFIKEQEKGAGIHFLDHDPEDIRTLDDSTSVHRTKRATCDLLSPFNVGHAACAAHCLTKGFRGGYCNSRGVCNCRR